MRRFLIAIGVAATLATAAEATEPEFPRLRAELLRDGSAIDLPGALRGGPHLLLVSFYADQRFAAERWLPALRLRLGDRAAVHHVVFAQDSGVLKRLLYTAYLRSIAANGTDDLVVFGDRNRFMRQTGITDDGVPQFILLDGRGAIALRVAGPLSSAAIERIAAAVEKSAAHPDSDREQRDQR